MDPWFDLYFFLLKQLGAGEVTQLFRTVTASAEDLSLLPSVHARLQLQLPASQH